MHSYCIEWVVNANRGKRWTGVGQDLASVVDRPKAEHKLLRGEAFRDGQFSSYDRVSDDSGHDPHALPFALANEILALFRGFFPNSLVSNALLDQKIVGYSAA